MDTTVLTVIRLSLVFIFVITLTIIVQSVANRIMKWISDSFQCSDFPQRLTILMIVLLYIVFAAILIDIFIWTAVALIAGLFTDFLQAFSFAAFNFTTTGTDITLQPPWEFLGSVIAINGIIIIAFAGASMFGLLYRPNDNCDVEDNNKQ